MIDVNDFAIEAKLVVSGCSLLGEFSHVYVETFEVEGRRPVLVIASGDIELLSIERGTALIINNITYAVRDIDENTHTTQLILEVVSNA